MTAARLYALVIYPQYDSDGSNVQVVARGDDHAPAGPDGAGGHQGAVLREGELLSGTAEVGDTGDDQRPL